MLSTVQQGDQLASLEALRDELARAIDIANGRISASEATCDTAAAAIAIGQIAALAKQLRDTMSAIAVLKDKQPAATSPVDQVAQQRAARQADAAVPTRAPRKVVGGTGSDRPVRKPRAGARAAPAARPQRGARGKP